MENLVSVNFNKEQRWVDTPLVSIAIPNWLISDKKWANNLERKSLVITNDLGRQFYQADAVDMPVSEIELIIAMSDTLVKHDAINPKNNYQCGFCFGALRQDHYRNKYFLISDSKVFEAIFTDAFVRAKQEYTPVLQKIVFWYAVEFFMQKGGTTGTPFSPNQIADFLKDMPIYFWEIE
jgi:hypothetical protein